MLQTLQTIALLCQVNSQVDMSLFNNSRITCQQEYISCLEEKKATKKNADKKLIECIKIIKKYKPKKS